MLTAASLGRMTFAKIPHEPGGNHRDLRGEDPHHVAA